MQIVAGYKRLQTRQNPNHLRDNPLTKDVNGNIPLGISWEFVKAPHMAEVDFFKMFMP